MVVSCWKPSIGAGVVWVKISLSTGQSHTWSYNGDLTTGLRMIVPSSHFTRALKKARKMLSGLPLAMAECKVVSFSPFLCDNCERLICLEYSLQKYRPRASIKKQLRIQYSKILTQRLICYAGLFWLWIAFLEFNEPLNVVPIWPSRAVMTALLYCNLG